MTPKNELRWRDELRKLRTDLKTPFDLMRRAASPEDFADTAIIGGISVAELLSGKVSEWQIPDAVNEAFRTQYPQHTSTFVQAVNRLSGNPAALQGLINGVKGKLFELEYTDWLNHGHLPEGFTAGLAHDANNPAWDVVIRDAKGHVNEFLQLKATASLSYVHEAIVAHPNIDVVIPHELYHQIADHPLMNHLIDSHQSLYDLSSQVGDATSHAEAAAVHFHVPYIAIGFIAWQNCKRYRNGNLTLSQAAQNFGERSALSVFAMGAGYAVSVFAHKTIVGIPFTMGARLLGSQLLHNRDQRKVLDAHLEIIETSQKHLQLRLLSAPLV